MNVQTAKDTKTNDLLGSVGHNSLKYIQAENDSFSIQ